MNLLILLDSLDWLDIAIHGHQTGYHILTNGFHVMSLIKPSMSFWYMIDAGHELTCGSQQIELVSSRFMIVSNPSLCTFLICARKSPNRRRTEKDLRVANRPNSTRSFVLWSRVNAFTVSTTNIQSGFCARNKPISNLWSSKSRRFRISAAIQQKKSVESNMRFRTPKAKLQNSRMC
jgi:hypothetical protein